MHKWNHGITLEIDHQSWYQGGCSLLFRGVNTSLSEAVARVIRRELSVDQQDITEFAVRAGQKPTTGWRQITGRSRMSIDDVDAYATALGWPLERLLRESATERDRAAQEPVTLSDHIASQLSAEAQEGIRKGREIVAGQKGRKRPIQ